LQIASVEGCNAAGDFSPQLAFELGRQGVAQGLEKNFGQVRTLIGC
jgi:hypothetical protein